MVVVSDEGKAIVDRPLRLVLPNGEVVESVLDENGFRVDDILEGECQVIFPVDAIGVWELSKAEEAR